ncbi:MAG TPA: biotin/lipoyl-containing protein [Ktedonobacterales bacterium]|jgi:biotin carboxyl carrier protein
MRYIASSGDQRFSISVGENGQQRRLTLDGAAYAADWLRIGSAEAVPGAGRYSLLINNRSYEVVVRRLEADDEGGQRYEVLIEGQPYEVRLEDERARALASLAGGGHEGGDASVKAPMPGLVVNIPVAVGDTVERGQTVAVLEAMKMENDLGAPRSGVVKEIRVTTGQAVNQGQPLVIVGDTGVGAGQPSAENGENGEITGG